MNEQQRLENAVDEFAAKMKDKLLKKKRQGWRGWRDPAYREIIENKLRDHTVRLLSGDTAQAVDVANLAMFLECMEQ